MASVIGALVLGTYALRGEMQTIVIVKVVSQHVEPFHPVAKLLGD